MPRKPIEIRIKDKRGGRFIVDDVVLNGYGKALGPYGIAVYVTLCRHANMQTQQCWPSHKTMSDKTGMSVAQVKRMLDRIEELKLITRETEVGKFTIYTLLEPKERHYKKPSSIRTPCTTELPPSSGGATTQLTQSYKGTKEGTKEGKKNIIKRKNKYSSIEKITEDDLKQISEKYKVPLGFVKLQLETLDNYCKSNGKEYKDYKAALRTFIINAMGRKIERRQQNGNKSGVDARNL